MEEDKTTIVNTQTTITKQMAESSYCIELFCKGESYRYLRDNLPINIGRDIDSNDLSISSTTASRNHCLLSLQDNQIGIIDKSTNGTYIKIGRADAVLIKNSFYPLISHGYISLGEPIDFESPEMIHFRVSADKEKNQK